MDFKTGKLHKIIREFKKGNGRYEINGIDLKNTVFLYREKAGAFIPIPKGNYKTIFNNNESILEVDDVINNKAIEFQIISVFDVQSYKYLEKYPELKMVVVQTNKIVDDINNIIGYLNSVGVKTDSKYQTQILTPLEPLSVWYMNAEGLIDTLPIDDFNKKFKEIIEKMSELVDEKAQEQVKKHLDELKTEIENFKNKKISEVLKELKTEKDNSIKEIEKIKEKSKSELNSRMPEINNKFNGIAGGTINPTFIQDDGEKTEGQYYLDRPTGKLYRCIKTTSNAVNSAEYFKDMSLNSIVNRLENLCKSEKLYDGKAKSVGEILVNKLPEWVKTLKIQGSNDDTYYFQDVYISVGTLKEKTVFVSIGTLNDIRLYGLSLKNGVLKIEDVANSNTTSDNNYIRKIYGLSY